MKLEKEFNAYQLVGASIFTLLVGVLVGTVIAGFFLTDGFNLVALNNKHLYWTDFSLDGSPHIRCTHFAYSEIADAFQCVTDSAYGFSSVGVSFDWEKVGDNAFQSYSSYYKESVKSTCLRLGGSFTSAKEELASCLEKRIGCLESCTFMYETNIYNECENYSSVALNEACEQSCEDNFSCEEGKI